MLGTRGCRLGILYPEIYEMQVEAIMRATAAVARALRRGPARRDHDPAGRLRAGARDHARARGADRRRAGPDGRRGLHGRHDDRAAAGVLRGQPDRRARRLLLVRHQRPDPDRARASRATTSSRSSCPSTWSARSSTARRSRRSTSRAWGGSCGSPPGSGARRSRSSSSASAASTAATRSRSSSSTWRGSTTCPARPTACRSRASRPRRPPSRTRNRHDFAPSRPGVAAAVGRI